MKIFTFRRFGLLTLLTLSAFFALIPSRNAQAFVAWSNSSGSATNFDWANGGSTYGLFGDPCLVGGDTLVFSPSGFKAESIYGESNYDSVSDCLEFELIAHSGLSFQGISITEYCDYEILGSGQVNISGSLSVENLDSTDILSDPLVSNPGMPVIGSDYTADSSITTAQVNIYQPDWTYIKVTLQNGLLAITYDDGSIAWIQKKVLGTSIAIQIIPEPATICLLAIGSLVFIKRKK